MKLAKLWGLLMIALLSTLADASPSRPVTMDSRIKTLVYSGNEIFRIVIHYGYQTVIEFAEGEEVQTISVGNNYAWQITPLDSRLFIKPLEENILTNMTIITNMRTYQFEVQSKTPSYTRDDELSFVIRFFYPDYEEDKIIPEVEASMPIDNLIVEKPFNYNYTISGPNSIAPLEIFDDGIGTFFQFDNKLLKGMPRFQVKDGKEVVELTARYQGKYIYVNKVVKELAISYSGKTINVFNESYNEAVK